MSFINKIIELVNRSKNCKIVYVLETAAGFVTGIAASNEELFKIAGQSDILYSSRTNCAEQLEKRFDAMIDNIAVGATQEHILQKIADIVAEVNRERNITMIRSIADIIESDECRQFLAKPPIKKKLPNMTSILLDMLNNDKISFDDTEQRFVTEKSLISQLQLKMTESHLDVGFSVNYLRMIIDDISNISCGSLSLGNSREWGYYILQKK